MSSQSDGSQSHVTVMAASSDPVERSLALGEGSSFETKPTHHLTIDKGSVPGQSEEHGPDVSVLTFDNDRFISRLLKELKDGGFQMYDKGIYAPRAFCFKLKRTTKTESREDSPQVEVPSFRKQGVLSEEAAKLRYTIVHLDSKDPFGIRQRDHYEREEFKTLVNATEHQGSCLIFVIGRFYIDLEPWLAEKVGKWPSVIYDPEHEFGWKGYSECSCIAKIISLVGNREGCPVRMLGPLQETLLESSSDPQRKVRVWYEPDSADFVLSKLRPAGLQVATHDLRSKITDAENDSSNDEDCRSLNALPHAVQGMHKSKYGAGCLTPSTLVVLNSDFYMLAARKILADQRTNHPLVIEMGGAGPDLNFYGRENCTVMVYPNHQPDKDEDFFHTLALLLADQKMDRKQRDMMNAFGLVRHAFFTSASDSQHGVHVVYSSDSSDQTFVLTQLKHVLETRVGLQQILPDTESTAGVSGEQTFFSAAQQCKHTLCVLGSGTSVHEGRLELRSNSEKVLLQSAVKEWEHPDALTVFIGRGENCPDWVLKSLETCTVMMYPRDQPDLDTLFWDTLSVLLADQTMDRKQRDIMNSFGPVRHASFTSASDSQQGVHVVYSSDSCDQKFVLTQLKQGLETRLGLQQILPDTGRTAIYSGQKKIFSAAQQRMHTLCILGSGSTSICDLREEPMPVLLQKVVEESEHSDAHTVFILTGKSRPGWDLEKLETCTVMVYPRDHSIRTVEFFDSLSGLLCLGNDSRHTSLLGHVVFEPEHLSKDGIHVIFDRIYSEFILTHLRQELVTNFGLRMILQDTETNSRQTPKRTFEDVLNSCPNVLVVSMGSYDKLLAVLLQQTLRCGQEHTQKTLFVRSVGEKLPEWLKQWKIGRTDTCEVSLSSSFCSWNPKIAANRLFLERLKTFFELPDLTLPVSSDNSNEKENSAASAYQERSNTGGEQVLSPMSQLEYRGETTCTDSKDFVAEMLEVPEPIFSRRWKAVSRFSNLGGTFRKSDSDIILDVPPNAVEEDLQVTIHTAVCTDTDRVRRVLKLSEDECVSSPVAEYWAGREFRFKKPVTITLPHFLPPDPDPSLVRVYRVTRCFDGQISVTRLRQDDPSRTPHGISQTDNMATEIDQLSENESMAALAEKSLTAEPAAEYTRIPIQGEFPWEESGSFLLTADGSTVAISTDHFSAYVCVYCGTRQMAPVLSAMVCGSQSQAANGQRTAHVTLHLWDRRLEIADFQQAFGIKTDQKIDETSLRLRDLPEELHDSTLYVRLELMGQERGSWQFCLKSDGSPATPSVQRFCSDEFVSCDQEECAKTIRERACPGRADWALENKTESQLGSLLRCVLDFCSTPAKQRPSWSSGKMIKTWPLEIPKKLHFKEDATAQISHATKRTSQASNLPDTSSSFPKQRRIASVSEEDDPGPIKGKRKRNAKSQRGPNSKHTTGHRDNTPTKKFSSDTLKREKEPKVRSSDKHLPASTEGADDRRTSSGSEYNSCQNQRFLLCRRDSGAETDVSFSSQKIRNTEGIPDSKPGCSTQEDGSPARHQNGSNMLVPSFPWPFPDLNFGENGTENSDVRTASGTVEGCHTVMHAVFVNSQPVHNFHINKIQGTSHFGSKVTNRHVPRAENNSHTELGALEDAEDYMSGLQALRGLGEEEPTHIHLKH